MKYVTLILAATAAMLLSGCRVSFTPTVQEASAGNGMAAAPEDTQVPERSELIAATMQVDNPKVILRAQTSLPPGTVLNVEMKPYAKEDEFEQIEAGQVEPDPKPVLTSEAVIGDNGEMELTVLRRPDNESSYRVDLMLIPDNQPEEVQADVEEAIAEGSVPVYSNGEESSGLRFSAIISEEEEWYGNHFTSDMQPPAN
ncbi:hypothetical protein [Rossellomorea marisflavi]|uniref:hypothetical protein n=1 Tax=Rossellomorea marisflavi TaxID=189381 RepID=UPI003D2ECDDD